MQVSDPYCPRIGLEGLKYVRVASSVAKSRTRGLSNTKECQLFGRYIRSWLQS
jgi:hypothetical protein